ncbi:MAG TPA: GGDEF domain-containing protein, partial [Helicobacteraceae bacterium]|nr:GGDEF domain-containing protein [Helicobacteraceae bacterium]
LITISKMLMNCVRASDLAARWGGEEFVVVSPETDIDAAYKMAEKLRLCIEEHDFEHVGQITCSFGVTSIQDSDDAHSFLTRADDALYAAKKAGRNCVVKL